MQMRIMELTDALTAAHTSLACRRGPICTVAFWELWSGARQAWRVRFFLRRSTDKQRNGRSGMKNLLTARARLFDGMVSAFRPVSVDLSSECLPQDLMVLHIGSKDRTVPRASQRKVGISKGLTLPGSEGSLGPF